MTLRRLQVTDFRCLQTADITLDSRFTLISGPNASGKSSVLEAIYLLGRGRSFRTRRVEQMIRSGSDRFVVFGEVEAAARRIALGVEGSKDGIRAKAGGQFVASVAELAPALPVQIIDPEIHKLIEEGPARRRRFIDWGVFHVEPHFMEQWQKFHLVLRQRNAALRARSPPAVTGAWDADLARYGELLTAARRRYVDLLAIEAGAIGRRLLGQELTIGFRAGWAHGVSLVEALRESAATDPERGFTQVGPQRAELIIRLDGTRVRDWVSRGQQKLVSAALLLAQVRSFPPQAAIQPTLLLDDPAAELDEGKLADLIAEVSSPHIQLVVTTLQPRFAALGAPGRRYRLSAGAVIAE